jgi:preprotein translocase subunit Sec63
MIKILAFTKHVPLTSQAKMAFSSFADPYYILGVDKSSPFPQIKKAFYKLANEFHPDKNDTQVNNCRLRSKLRRSSSSSRRPSKPLRWRKA